MTQWHYADRNHQQCGPVDDVELVRLFRNGDIGLENLVWHSALPQWQAPVSYTHLDVYKRQRQGR